MSIHLLDFTPEQWQFLANLEVCGVPIPVSVCSSLTPLKSKLLIHLLEQSESEGWVHISEDDLIGLSEALPESVRYELQLLNTPDRISALLNSIRAKELFDRMDKRAIIKLLSDTGNNMEASEMETELAHSFLVKGNHDLAYQYLGRAVQRLNHHITNGRAGGEALFLKSVLEFSNLSFVVGRGMRPLLSYLQTAVELAESFGDERFSALGNLHLGRLEAYFGNNVDGEKHLTIGKKKVESLGDTDILKAAAELLGFYYTQMGQFDKGIVHFERAEQNFTQNEDQLLFYPVMLWYFGISLFMTGRTARALGLLKNYWFLAETKGWPGIALITRAILGLVLAVIRKRDDAVFHVNAVIKESLVSNNEYALFIARSGLAIHLYSENQIEQSYHTLKKAFEKEKEATSAPAWISLFCMELLIEFYHLGYESVSKVWNFKNMLTQEISVINESHPFMALSSRWKADQRVKNGEPTSRVRKDLETIKNELEQDGFKFALNHTMISLVRLYLHDGESDKAKSLALELFQNAETMCLGRDFIPSNIRGLLKAENTTPDIIQTFQTRVEQYFKLLSELDNPDDENSLVYNMVAKLLQFFGAERSALFQNKYGKSNRKLHFINGCNLTRQETESKGFSNGMSLVQRAFKEKRIIIKSFDSEPKNADRSEPKMVLVFPINMGTEVQGVGYFENSFVQSMLDHIPLPFIEIFTDHLTRDVRISQKLIRLQAEVNRFRSFKSTQFVESEKEVIITNDPKMDEMLTNAQIAALSEATLLVTGETGTGKELLVNRIHTTSNRATGALITVDATTIPENLVESELFGHEKGAFTGAVQRKQGKIELAHEGTLFIDEIGELPLPAQAKLLRALENGRFYRVGGTQFIQSDFRLVAATHRDLAEETAAGRFRQDLYYRLNVITCELPPLRERGQDIILLANHFLERYCEQYGLPEIRFDSVDEVKMMSYSWPGNVRELKNIIERAVILSNGNKPSLDLPSTTRISDAEVFLDMPSMEEMQRRYIQKVLEKTNGRINGAAAILEMKRTTLYARMNKLGIRRYGKR